MGWKATTLNRLLGQATSGPLFLGFCMAFAFAGTLTAALPVTVVIVSATLLRPARWRAIALGAALGSALGATLLVALFHQLGWDQVYERFPDMVSHPTWQQVVGWVSRYGPAALLLIAATPLPQTPALIFFGIVRQDYGLIFIAMLLGKLIKYGVVALVTKRITLPAPTTPSAGHLP